MNILVTGKNGQVGHALMQSLSSLGNVVGVDIDICDLANPAQIKLLLEQVKPALIVNPAAFTAVDKAEQAQAVAFAVNATAPEVLAQYAQQHQIPIIHFSTDYVFDGTKKSPYIETDATNPASVYGHTKWLGEEAVRKHATKHIILRTSWVFGSHGGNFLKTIIKLAQTRDQLAIVSDQWGAPTSAEMLASVTVEIVKQLFLTEASSKFGTYHLVADGEANWHAYAQYVVATAANLGVPFKVLAKDIQPITTQQYPTPAARPANSRLNTDKVKKAFNLTLPAWQTQVDIVLKKLINPDGSVKENA